MLGSVAFAPRATGNIYIDGIYIDGGQRTADKDGNQLTTGKDCDQLTTGSARERRNKRLLGELLRREKVVMPDGTVQRTDQLLEIEEVQSVARPLSFAQRKKRRRRANAAKREKQQTEEEKRSEEEEVNRAPRARKPLPVPNVLKVKHEEQGDEEEEQQPWLSRVS